MASDGSKGTCVSQTHWGHCTELPSSPFLELGLLNGAGSRVPARVAAPSSAAPLPPPPPPEVAPQPPRWEMQEAKGTGSQGCVCDTGEPTAVLFAKVRKQAQGAMGAASNILSLVPQPLAHAPKCESSLSPGWGPPPPLLGRLFIHSLTPLLFLTPSLLHSWTCPEPVQPRLSCCLLCLGLQDSEL